VYPRRVYPLDPRELTEEQIAVAFAMTSRRPEPFDEIARQVSQEKAAEFHERWVVGYGHASVAEHAVLHMAVENISRLACDTLEDNRLASYTEKSSRYQVLHRGAYYVPPELDGHPLRDVYITTCNALFDVYHNLAGRMIVALERVEPRLAGEKDTAYNMRLRRIATDNCRFVLPAATLTNVGVTMNARVLEHACSKLLSSPLAEERELGEALKSQARTVTPTLVKYAERNDYLVGTREAHVKLCAVLPGRGGEEPSGATLVHYDSDAEAKVVSALLYRYSSQPYAEILRRVQRMTAQERGRVLDEALSRLGPHDSPLRELEYASYTFDFVMDYGAYREFKRHRMLSYIAQPLTVAHGFVLPELFEKTGLAPDFLRAMEASQRGYERVSELSPVVAQYLATHAHRRRVLSQMNLRECYHFFKLRTSSQAHFTIREVAKEALRRVMDVHPALFRHLKLRD
jgi:thymidylate synthase ThyX